jgi:hypothetical protein
MRLIRESRTDDRRRYHWGEDSNAAVFGICALGPDARGYLTELRQLASQGVVPKGIQDSATWRAMLVSAGADPEEFVPTGRNATATKYREELKQMARKRCGAKR